MSPGDYVLIGVLAFLVFLGILFFILWYTNPKFRAKFGICKSGALKTEEKTYTVVSPKKHKHRRSHKEEKAETLNDTNTRTEKYLSLDQTQDNNNSDWPITKDKVSETMFLDDNEPILPPDYESMFENGGKTAKGSYLKEEDYVVNPRNIAIEDELPLR